MKAPPPIHHIAAGLAIGLSMVAPQWVGLFDEAVLVAALLLGLPHGALDDHVEAHLSGLRRGRAAFYGVYLGSIALMALIWWLSPALALLGFLLLAGIHFGEADTQDLPIDALSRWILVGSRALVVIALPLVVWPAQTWPNVAALLGSDVPAAPPWLPDLIVPLLLQHFILFAFLSTDEPKSIWNTVLVTALFLFATPALSLAVYFGLWHSTRHLDVLRRALGWRSMKTVLWFALPLTVASAMGLLMLIGGMLWLGSLPKLLTVALLLISGLTLPHALLTHHLLRRLPTPAPQPMSHGVTVPVQAVRIHQPLL